VATQEDPIFGLHVPTQVPGVPGNVLTPRSTWADGDAYDEAARKLADMFRQNFEKYAERAPDSVGKAGPAA
jgi:phosphoenolpyruvate carboxykinase (ATP)